LVSVAAKAPPAINTRHNVMTTTKLCLFILSPPPSFCFPRPV
jgi:hypothetical protein